MKETVATSDGKSSCAASIEEKRASLRTGSPLRTPAVAADESYDLNGGQGKKRARHNRCDLVSSDMIFVILVRLTAKSVGRYRCVSQHWLSLTLEPEFIQRYASLTPISGFFVHVEFHASHIPLENTSQLNGLPDPSLLFLKEIIISGSAGYHGPPFSCKGLLLHQGSLRRDYTKNFYICNPMTKQFLTILQPSTDFVYGHALAFDPLKPSQFKVATWGRSLLYRGQLRYSLHVYSSMTQSWKVVYEADNKESDEWELDCKTRRAISWKGSLAWEVRRGSFFLLDMEEERVRRVPQPDLMQYYLGESSGYLHFIGAVGYLDCIDILEMESELTGWSVLYHFDLAYVRDLYPEMVREELNEFVCFVRGQSRSEDQLILLSMRSIQYGS